MPRLFGRDAELAGAFAALDPAAGSALLTITGPPGVGKTAVAREVSARRADAGEDVLFVDLRGEPGRARLAWASGAALVVLDGVDATRDEVAELARARPRRALVTGSEPLGVPGERVLRLAPLDEESAVALFEHARAALADAEGEPEPDRDTVAAVVRRLDGLPLAITLAAGRAAVLSLPELLVRLDDPLRLLRSSEGALEHSIAASVALLSPAERRALDLCSVFEGAFSAEQFEAAFGPALEGDPIDALQALVRKSFLAREPTRGALRLRVTTLVRAFVRRPAEGGAAADLEPEVQRRYAEDVVARAELAAARAYGAAAEQALDELSALAPDVLAVTTGPRAASLPPALAARGWLALFDALLFRDVLGLSDPRFRAMIEVADRAGGARYAVRARVLAARAGLEVGPPEESERLAREAVEGAAGDASLTGEARRALGWSLLAGGRLPEALGHFEAALADHAATGDVRGQADALAASGLAEALLGRSRDEALAKLALARALHVGQGDAPRLRKVDEMARLLGASAGEIPAGLAESSLQASAARHASRGQRWREAIDLALLAHVVGAQGRPIDAEALRVRARAAAAAAGVALPPDAPSEDAPAWVVSADARLLVSPDGAEQDLSRHGPLRRVLGALVTARLDSPGRALSADQVLASGWPGEKVLHDAGMLRVYSIVRRLRHMGLDGVLLTRDDGYLLDPAVPLRRGA